MAIYFKLPALPFQDRLQGEGGLVATIWNRWLQALVDRVQRAHWHAANVSLSAQSASIAATVLGPALPAGLYSLSWYARVTTAATSSSSLQVTASWTDGGVACSYSGAALTGNTTATVESLSLPLIHVDGATQVSYATTYASSGATAMDYSLSVVLYRVGEL